MRRPELFAIAGCEVVGPRLAVIARLARSLQTEPNTVAVVRSLYRMVRSLPDLSWRTNRLSPPTLGLRSAFERAHGPEQLLFTELPEAVGLPPIPREGLGSLEVEEFFTRVNECLSEWGNVAGRTYAEAQRTLLAACGFEATAVGWQQLREAATRLAPHETDLLLRPFLCRMVESTADAAGMASVLAIVAGRPPASWLDADVERFPKLASTIGDLLRQAGRRAGLRGDSAAALATLDERQREDAQALAKTLQRQLGGQRQEVVRAALLLLGESVAWNRDGGEA